MLKQLSTFLLLILLSTAAFAQNKAYLFRIDREIGPQAWRSTKKALVAAKEQQSNVILIHMNTFGGMVDYADSIRTALLQSPIKTIVFIDYNAASAGALIALAADKIYMVKGGSIGAASVVNQQGEIMPEKYQSYMRGLMRATAE